MKIPILQSLESQRQWLTFSAQEIPYAYINSPLSLVDFQSSFLQITAIEKNLRDGRRATKFSIGSKKSSEAAWALIESCQWSLKKVLAGLNSLDFSSNVRDNSALNVHSDLSVRQFFSKDKCVISPLLLQQLSPLTAQPRTWYLNDVKRLLSCEQYSDLKWLSKHPQFNSVHSVLLQLISYPEGWRIDRQKNYLVLSLKNTFILRFRPDINLNGDTIGLLQQI
ncbi:MAG: hypothetical protein OFPI_25330 [Osedax symbiont Rs2]|nr:MAG: hypothetical protein OFPI_25330 [Osedax symbiont Rs2]